MAKGFQEKGEPVNEEFKAWFAGEWKDIIESTSVPGMPFSTWDRKAAWVAWQLMHGETVKPGVSVLPYPPEAYGNEPVTIDLTANAKPAALPPQARTRTRSAPVLPAPTEAPAPRVRTRTR